MRAVISEDEDRSPRLSTGLCCDGGPTERRLSLYQTITCPPHLVYGTIADNDRCRLCRSVALSGVCSRVKLPDES